MMSTTERTLPFSGMTSEEAVARAKVLAPTIRERATKAEVERRQPQETIQGIIDAGLVRLLVPKRWGGDELPFDALVNSTIEIGKADASAAWCYAFLISHSWVLAQYPDEAQRDVWANTPDVPMATAFIPAGKATRVDGGYQLSGNWPWSSGIDHCDWSMLAGLVAGVPPDPLIFLVPKADYEIEDTWFVAGQKATGSKNVIVKDVFVPEHRVVRLGDLSDGKGPGAAVNSNPMYRLPLITAYPTALTSPILGATIGAYEAWRNASRTKFTRFSHEQVSAFTHQQIRLAEIEAEIETARLFMQRILDAIRNGGPLPFETRARNRRDFAYISRLCVHATEQIFNASGGGANYETNPLQRYWRDVHAMTAHAGINFDAAGENFGRFELGLKPNPHDPYI